MQIPIPAGSSLYKQIKKSPDAMKDQPLIRVLMAYASNYLQKEATDNIKGDSDVGKDWSGIQKRTRLYTTKSSPEFFERSDNVTGLRILPYDLARDAGLIEVECNRLEYRKRV